MNRITEIIHIMKLLSFLGKIIYVGITDLIHRRYQGLGLLIVCLTLGTFTLITTKLIIHDIRNSLEQEKKTIIGGNISFSLHYGEATKAEKEFFQRFGEYALTYEKRGIVQAKDGSIKTTAEIKAIDRHYPLFGTLELLDSLHNNVNFQTKLTNTTYPAYADADLLKRLTVQIGDTITLGNVTLTLIDTIVNEPDALSSSFQLAPRLIIPHNALKNSGLMRENNSIIKRYKLKIAPDKNSDTPSIVQKFKEEFTAERWNIRHTEAMSNRIVRIVDNFDQFMLFVSYTAFILAGTGIAIIVRNYLNIRQHYFAALCLADAPRSFVNGVLIVQLMSCTAIAIIVAFGFGTLIWQLLLPTIETYIKLELGHNFSAIPYLETLLITIIFGIVSTFPVFIFLYRSNLRRLISRNLAAISVWQYFTRWDYCVYTLLLTTCIGLLLIFSTDLRFGLMYMGALIGGYIFLWFSATGLIYLLKRYAPYLSFPIIGITLAYLQSSRQSTLINIIVLGIFFSLFSALLIVNANIERIFSTEDKKTTVDYFFLDISRSEVTPFKQFFTSQKNTQKLSVAPMLRGRILAINDTAIDQLNIPNEIRWVVENSRGVSYASALPTHNKLVTGKWWEADYNGAPLVSFEHDIAQKMGIKLGDTITLSINGKKIRATIANTRKLQWRGFNINFVMIFSPHTFANAPVNYIATLSLNDRSRSDFLQSFMTQFPYTTFVNIQQVVKRVAQLNNAFQYSVLAISAVIFLSGLLTLIGVISSQLSITMKQTAIFRMLGITRKQITQVTLLQYIIYGLIAAFISIFIGIMAGWFVVDFIMRLEFFIPFYDILTIAFMCLTINTIIALYLSYHLCGIKTSRYLSQDIR